MSILIFCTCVLLVEDLFLLWVWERFHLSDSNQADVVETVIFTSNYLDDLLHYKNP